MTSNVTSVPKVVQEVVPQDDNTLTIQLQLTLEMLELKFDHAYICVLMPYFCNKMDFKHGK
jgi:hypothetical protein